MKFQVLKGLRSALSLTSLSGERHSIPNTFFQILFMLPMYISLTLLMLYAWDNGLNLSKTAGAIGVSLSIIQSNLIYICLATNRKLTSKVLADFQTIVEDRYQRSIESRAIYGKIEKRNDDLLSFCFKVTVFTDSTLFIPTALIPISHALFGLPASRYWPLPFSYKSYLDMQTFAGFYINLLSQATTGITYMAFISALIILQVGMCSYIEALTDDFNIVFGKINKIIANPPANGTVARNLQKHLIEAVELHKSIFRSLDNVQKMMNAPLFFQLLVFTVFIAFSMLSLDQGPQDLSYEIVQNLNCLHVQLYMNYAFCNHADNLSRRSSGIADVVYNSDWFKMPMKQRRMLLMIITRAQVPFYLWGFQLLSCSLQSFQMLIRKSFSVFLLFRQFKGTG